MVKRGRRPEESPKVAPLDVDGVRTVAIGTVLWAAAFVLLALRKDSLDEQGHGWWLWTSLAGVGLGLLGLDYTRRRRDAIALARLEEEAELPDDVEPLDQADDLGHLQAGEEIEALDVGPPIPAPTGRRARRAARTSGQPVPAPPRVEPDEPEPAREPEPAPEPGPAREPDLAGQARVARQPDEDRLLDVPDPVVQTGDLEQTRAWDYTRPGDEAVGLDEPGGLHETGELGETGDHRVGGRRARRKATRKNQPSTDSDSAYRGRRARRR
jgi:hypothetical protein